jgi:hypothetical protein
MGAIYVNVTLGWFVKLLGKCQTTDQHSILFCLTVIEEESVPAKRFQPRLKFAGKARSLP